MNGIRLSAHADDATELCSDQLDQHADIQGISEHNQDTHQYDLRQRFQQAAKTIFGPQHVLELGSSEYRSLTAYKPGGTGLIAHGPITGRIYERGSDKHGRWSYFHLQAAHGQSVTVIQVYQVCIKPTNATGCTAYHQQEIAFSLEGRSDIRPRKNFRQDLTRFITRLQTNHHHIILMGDFNESIYTNGSTVQTLSLDKDLIDIWSRRFPDLPEFNTHLRGSKRIDYMLISPTLIPAVTAVGYEPFHETCATDHRGIFIDFDTTALFGITHLPVVPAHLRSVQSKHPACRETYIRASSNHGYQHSLFSRLENLIQSGERNDDLLETLDTLLGQCCSVGETKCTNVRTPWYTKRMSQLRKWRRILQKLVSHYRNYPKINNLAVLQEQHLQAAIEHPFPPDLATTYTELNATKRLIHQEMAACRTKRLQEQAEQIALEHNINNPDHAKIISQISASEQRHTMWNMFRTIRGKTSKQGISRIQIPDSWPSPTSTCTTVDSWPDAKAWDKDSKPFRTISIPHNVEYYLLARNRSHFGKAQGTPFTVPPLRDELHWDADTNQAELILEGNYDDTELDDITQLLLSFCTRVSPPDTIPATLTRTDFEAKLQTWRESTSTSPSGRHLGHYKSLLRPIGFRGQNPHDSRMLEIARTDLLQAHLNILNYCLMHGYSLKRWQNIVNVMILKEPGNVKIHRLRVIHLYEADYNLMLSLKWRSLQRHADAHNLLNDGQYGSRSGRESTALPLFEELRTDIALCSRKPFINFDNDADSCYDRIVVAMSSLLSKKYGMHRHVVMVNAHTLQQARYTLKTSLGISEDSYSHSDAFPIFGTGQGSGNSPVIWCFISSTLFDSHESKAYGAVFETPDRSLTLTFSMVGFVDDSTGTVNDFSSTTTPTVESLVHKMQHDAQLWNDLLWCSGGKLELPKCSYHFMYFDFQADGTPVPRHDRVGPPLVVTSPTGTDIPIPAKSIYAPHKTLGHYKAPSGSATTQLRVLTDKQNRISQYLASSPASRSDAYTYYHCIYLPSIHVLPQSFFSSKDLDKAESKSMPSIFAKTGYNRNTYRPLLYGPQNLLGGGFIRWKWLQGEGQIKHFIKYWRTTDRVSKALRIAVAWFQYHAGVGFSLLQYPSRTAPPSAGRWLPALRQFLATIQASLELDQPYIPPLQRLGDRLIMDVAIDADIFTLNELTIVNHCRLSLNIATLADLVDATGVHLNPGIRWGEPASLPYTPNGHTPLQEPPSLLFWTYWQRLLNLLFDSNDRLLLPLGPWLYPGNQLRNTWSAYFDHRYKFLYRRTSTGYLQYELFDQHFIAGMPTPWTPNEHCIPVSIQETSRDCWTLLAPPQPPVLHPPPHIPTTFHEYLAQLPTAEHHLFSTLHLTYPIYEIMEKLHTDTSYFSTTAMQHSSHSDTSSPPAFLLVSDGSDLHGTMTFGWSLSTMTGDRLIFCSGPAFGKGSSHRAEATGMLSGLRVLYHLTQYTGVPIPTPYVLKTDNQGLLQRTTQRLDYASCYPNSTLAADWDIIEFSHHTIQSLPQTPELAHVKGHQDRQRQYHHLSLDAQLNVDADAEAGNYHLNHHLETQPRVPLFPTTKVHLHIQGETVTSHYSAAIRAAAAEPDYITALSHTHHWTLATTQSIDFPTIRLATANSPLPRPFLFKFAHKCLPTQAQKSKWDNGSDQCLHCNVQDDQAHFYRCTTPATSQWRAKFIHRFRARCEALKTSLELQSVFVDALSALFNARTISATNYPSHLRSTIHAQQKLGWQSFFRGFWTKGWIQLQQSHLSRHHITKPEFSTSVWASTLTRLLWQGAHDAWKLHNTVIHGPGRTPTDTDLRERTLLKVRSLHQRRSDVLHSHRDLYFLHDLPHALVHSSTTALRNWIQLYEPAIHASIRLRSIIATQQVREITTYFSPIPSKRPPKPRHSARTHTRHDAHSKLKRLKHTPGPRRYQRF